MDKARSTRFLRWFAGAFSGIPLIVIWMLINKHGINIPVIDGWEMFLAPYLNDSLFNWDLGTFWALRNQGVNRKFIPMVIGALILKTTNFNLVAINYLNASLVYSIAFLGYRIYSKSSEWRYRFLALPVFSWVLLGMSIWPYWIQPIFLEVILSILGLFLSIFFVVQNTSWKALTLSIGSAVISSLSFFTGNLTWFVVPLLFHHYGYRKFRHYLVWFGSAALVLIPFLLGYLQEEHVQRISAPSLSDLAKYLYAFIGSPMAWTQDFQTASSTGVMILIIFALGLSAIGIWIKSGVKRAIPWISIGAWVLLNGGFSAVGRMDYGGINLENAIASRYTVYGTLFFLTVCVILIILMSEEKKSSQSDLPAFLASKYFPTAALVFLLTLYGGISFQSLQPAAILKSTHTERNLVWCRERYLVVEDACFGAVHSNKIVIRAGIARLENRGIYKKQPSDLPLRFADPETSLSSEILLIGGTEYPVYAQKNGTSARWTVHLPGQQNWVFYNDPLDGVWMKTGIFLPESGDPPVVQSYEIAIYDTEGVSYPDKIVQQDPDSKNIVPIILNLSDWAGTTIDIVFSFHDNETHALGYWMYPQIFYKYPGSDEP